MNELGLAWEALRFGGVMVYPLAAMAIAALAIILEKAYVYARLARLPHALHEIVEGYGFAWEDLDRRLRELAPDNVYARFLRVLADDHTRPAWWLESRAGDAALDIERGLARGMWVLETIVTAAPLLGLLGTITGMMQSFKLIGGQGLVDPTGVTSGVAQALIATAFGLLIALVALFGFNFFSRRQAATLDQLEHLGTRVLDNVRLGAEGAHAPQA